jgi:hypothetical protein
MRENSYRKKGADLSAASIDYLKKSKMRLPLKILTHYLDRGLISDPLTATDKTFLEKLNKLWHDRPTIGCMLARVPEKERDLLPDTWMLTRAERWVVSRFYHADEGKKYPPRIATVIQEMANHRLPAISLERLKQLQTIARNRRKKEKRKQNKIQATTPLAEPI